MAQTVSTAGSTVQYRNPGATALFGAVFLAALVWFVFWVLGLGTVGGGWAIPAALYGAYIGWTSAKKVNARNS